MKKVIIASIVSLVLSASAFATPLQQKDMQQIFGKQATTVQVAQLSDKEMEATTGDKLDIGYVWNGTKWILKKGVGVGSVAIKAAGCLVGFFGCAAPAQ